MATALKYTETRIYKSYKVDVKVRLSDDCRNGHADFAITADIYEKNKYDCWKWTAGGCCHEEIAVVFPELRPFIALHLSDAKGAPMYAQGNGFYHLRNSPKKLTMEYLRITDIEYNRFFREAEDQLYFTYLLQTIEVPERWMQEAQAAIKQLEQLTGEKFEDTSVRYQFTPLTLEEFQLVESRIAEGYYLPENIRKRKHEAKLAARRKKIADLKATALSQKRKIERELNIKLYVLRSGLPIDNFIYYNHNNKGVFNWMDSSCYQKITQAQFDRFIKKVDYTKLPEGIEFQLKSA
ncbi:hypothetical protein [Bacteroides xylanisolvens]|uniref:hypothetical protein n=1 Tax=Bacteroides xylanisolvens TaxID=371601 RepID=UPI0039B455E4